MKTLKINIPTLADLPAAATGFIASMESDTVFAFEAPMGGGKTTLIAEICRQLGVTDDISSPTFAIVNEYRSDIDGRTIYHFDCYRIEEDEEALDMGVEDYLFSGHLCLIEWPDRISRFLPEDTVKVIITQESEA
ncbi:MAG: tRNA (adenosine(37)-N6)-threonylcarbamoyltransferase complex ATPase subunit type 1 TsaE [Muribaculaceae bacterium]|nr:tRNA (adenosine(37)-N6)-threonylcarbamoyltransferase complex ATPase subunit type 1 TsaE [Muribaculaceae bacterium]